MGLGLVVLLPRSHAVQPSKSNDLHLYLSAISGMFRSVPCTARERFGRETIPFLSVMSWYDT